MTKRVIPDYSNQLDLFSEATEEAPAPTAHAPARTFRPQDRPRPPEQLRFIEWLPLPPEDAPQTPAPISTPPSSRGDADEVQQSPFESGTGQEEERSPSLGGIDRRVASAGTIFDIEPEEKPSRDFLITSAHRIGEGSLHEKARDNITAIRLLNALEAANREATGDEKPMLARYVGWGGLPNVFALHPSQEWRSTTEELKELLTGPEFESARASTPNAHFTSPQVIDAIWSGLRRLGLGKGARVLEPAMGVGHFFGLMPESMQGGHKTGVELDSITARIAQKLYPDSTIFARGFEETPLPDNYFDAVVGNVPFG